MSATAKWIIGVLITIAIASSGYVIGRVDRVDTDLQSFKMSSAKDAVALAKEQVIIAGALHEKFVLKEDFKSEISDIKKQLGKIADKQDDLLKEIRRK